MAERHVPDLVVKSSRLHEGSEDREPGTAYLGVVGVIVLVITSCRPGSPAQESEWIVNIPRTQRQQAPSQQQSREEPSQLLENMLYLATGQNPSCDDDPDNASTWCRLVLETACFRLRLLNHREH